MAHNPTITVTPRKTLMLGPPGILSTGPRSTRHVYVVVSANRREESGGGSKVNVHISMFVSSLSGQIDQRSRKRE